MRSGAGNCPGEAVDKRVGGGGCPGWGSGPGTWAGAGTLRRPVPSDFFIVAMAGLEFTLVQINSRTLRSTVYNPNFFRIFKVFKSLRALRAARILRRLRSAGPPPPSREEGTEAWAPRAWAATCCRGLGGLQTPARFCESPAGSWSSFASQGLGSSRSLASQGPLCSASARAPGHRSPPPPPPLTQPPCPPLPSFLTSLQEVTGTLVRSMPSITAILVLMFTCLCILCCGAGCGGACGQWGRMRGNQGPGAGAAGPARFVWP